MQNEIKREIKRLANRVLSREALRRAQTADYQKRFEKRTNIPATLTQNTAVPRVDRHFDPKYCKRNSNSLAKLIWHKVIALSYEPKPALNFFIDKPSGGKRSLMAFSIPDSALANVLMRRIRERNIKKFSPHSFAYHPDKNVFDAILALRFYLRKDRKIFCVQIDFKDYFDSIPHSYISKILNDRDVIAVTNAERHALERFMKHRYAQRTQYMNGNFTRRHRGTPQGSSVSLILSNLANHALDIELERLSGKFVRFADDVTALCDNYEDALRIEQSFQDHCTKSGITINQVKSPGIAILADKNDEIRTVHYFDYLGYRFTKNNLTLSDRKIKNIKRKVSRLVDIYMINPIQKINLNYSRVGLNPNFDWDLLGLIYEIRNYIYGGLSEQAIKEFLDGGKRLTRMKGLMGFYALLEDQQPLKSLDGWLANQIKRACIKRRHILANDYQVTGLTISQSELVDGSWLDPQSWNPNSPLPEAQLPSFLFGWRAARKYYMIYGVNDIATDEVESYSYELP